MNKKVLLVPFLSLILLNANPQMQVASLRAQALQEGFADLKELPILKISEENITYYKEALKHELGRNQYARYATSAALAGIFSYLGYRILFAKDIESKVPKVSENKIQNGQELDNKAVNWAAYQYKKDHDEKHSVSTMRFMYNWFKEASYQTMQQVIVLGIFTGINKSLGPIGKYISYFDGVSERFFKHVYHNGDLPWYLSSHCALNPVFNDLLIHAGMLEGKRIEFRDEEQLIKIKVSLGKEGQASEEIAVAETESFDEPDIKVYDAVVVVRPEEIPHRKAVIKQSWNMLVGELEKIIGFIEYRQSLISEEQLFLSLRVADLIETLKQRVDRTGEDLAVAIEREKFDGFSLIHDFYEFLDRELLSFANFELYLK